MSRPGGAPVRAARPAGALPGRLDGATAFSSRQPSRAARWLTLVWALLPLVFAVPAAPCFAWAAWRLRSRALAAEAGGYLAATVLWITLANQSGTLLEAGALIAIVTAIVACTRAFLLRGRLLGETPWLDPERSALTARAPAQADAGWTPTFPAQTLPPHDPANPATWVSALACTGSDRHSLSMPLLQAAAYGAGGAALVGVDAYLHVYGRGLGVGIALILAPLFAVLFARWVDGPVLYYRTWGRLHRLTLTSVGAVSVGKPAAGSIAVALSAPGRARPLRVSLRSRGYVMAPAARDHLRAWLSAPHVRWSADAAALFDEHTTPRTAATRRRHRLLATGLTAVPPLAAVAIGAWLVFAIPGVAIPGAPGYRTFGGPHGKLLAVGRPWGRPCQPIRFAVDQNVPDWMYEQAAAVVAEARRDGIDAPWSPAASSGRPHRFTSCPDKAPPAWQRWGSSP